MPMCPCPDCRQIISSSAPTCVFCGADTGGFEKRSLRITAIASVVAGIVSLAGLALYGFVNAASPDASTRAQALVVRPTAAPAISAFTALEGARPEAGAAASVRDEWIVIAPQASQDQPIPRDPP